MDTQLTKQLLKARQALKKKYKSLKNDIVKSQSQLEKTYQPITEPLKELVSNLGKHIKQEPVYPKLENTLLYNSPPKDIHRLASSSLFHEPNRPSSFFQPSHEETFETDNQESDNQETVERDDEYIDDSIRQFTNELNKSNVYKAYLEQYTSPLPRDYIQGNISDVVGEYDHVLGVYHNMELEKFFIGDSELKFVGPDILIQEVTYKGTPGLYELIFKKTPLGYKPKDADDYSDIIRRTNAIHKENKFDAAIRKFPNDIRDKYDFIIKPRMESRPQFRSRIASLPDSLVRGVLTRSKKGKGMTMMNYSRNPIDYKYFDDYNELINRLRLLIASQSAGNTGHNNEIVSIIEELREGGIIK